MKIKRLSESARLPTRANKSDAGWDLYSSEETSVLPSCRRTISTSVALAVPEGCVGLIWPRSGLAVKDGIDVLAGVVDAGYRGEVKVCLYNCGEKTFQIETGDRIAQILIQKIEDVELVETDNLETTQRGDDGFGSSGR
mgnify:FL=1